MPSSYPGLGTRIFERVRRFSTELNVRPVFAAISLSLNLLNSASFEFNAIRAALFRYRAIFGGGRAGFPI